MSNRIRRVRLYPGRITGALRRKAHYVFLVRQMKLVSRFGTDGIFTDRTDAALEVYGRGGPFNLEAVFERIGY